MISKSPLTKSGATLVLNLHFSTIPTSFTHTPSGFILFSIVSNHSFFNLCLFQQIRLYRLHCFCFGSPRNTHKPSLFILFHLGQYLFIYFSEFIIILIQYFIIVIYNIFMLTLFYTYVHLFLLSQQLLRDGKIGIPVECLANVYCLAN